MCTRPEALNLGLVTASSVWMYSIHAKMLIWVRFADDFLHPGMPSPNMVVGSGDDAD